MPSNQWTRATQGIHAPYFAAALWATTSWGEASSSGSNATGKAMSAMAIAIPADALVEKARGERGAGLAAGDTLDQRSPVVRVAICRSSLRGSFAATASLAGFVTSSSHR